jgi:hypothetical protein
MDVAVTTMVVTVNINTSTVLASNNRTVLDPYKNDLHI